MVCFSSEYFGACTHSVHVHGCLTVILLLLGDKAKETKALLRKMNGLALLLQLRLSKPLASDPLSQAQIHPHKPHPPNGRCLVGFTHFLGLLQRPATSNVPGT